MRQCYNEHKASGKCRCAVDPLRTLLSLLPALFCLLILLRTSLPLLSLFRTLLRLLALHWKPLPHLASPSWTLRNIMPSGPGPTFALPSSSNTPEASIKERYCHIQMHRCRYGSCSGLFWKSFNIEFMSVWFYHESLDCTCYCIRLSLQQ